MAWTVPKIKAMLIKVAPVRPAKVIGVGKVSAAHYPSPRIFAGSSKSAYGVK